MLNLWCCLCNVTVWQVYDYHKVPDERCSVQGRYELEKSVLVSAVRSDAMAKQCKRDAGRKRKKKIRNTFGHKSCFERCLDDPESMRFRYYKCFSCFFEEHQCNYLYTRDIFFFMIRVQQNLARSLSFLSSLLLTVFACSKLLQVLSHFLNNLTGPLSLLHCGDIQCTYVNCCSDF